jgi:hypothetical protein
MQFLNQLTTLLKAIPPSSDAATQASLDAIIGGADP